MPGQSADVATSIMQLPSARNDLRLWHVKQLPGLAFGALALVGVVCVWVRLAGCQNRTIQDVMQPWAQQFVALLVIQSRLVAQALDHTLHEP